MLSLRVAALALTAGLLATAPAPALQTPKSPPAENAQVVRELRQVVALLNQANHDYKGHRAAAVHEIHQAIKALEPQKTPHPPKTQPGAPKPPAVRENQQQSDDQLRQAIQQLHAIRTQLVALPGAHHKRAAADLSKAIKELEVALTIK